ncbi:hypothetical protein CBNA_1957 [Coxiella burnetii str. Namibia]|nr:hypothetical protein CBNA_1957 [Coxiella burnetii str. Namibia]
MRWHCITRNGRCFMLAFLHQQRKAASTARCYNER